ncbi:hypothetical protein EDB89DRAFT_1904736 [Lactarius sanguifluus]|nr:hypothetical protein EDB89DRAFT_1904736 [Lactarius sanguifluus]
MSDSSKSFLQSDDQQARQVQNVKKVIQVQSYKYMGTSTKGQSGGGRTGVVTWQELPCWGGVADRRGPVCCVGATWQVSGGRVLAWHGGWGLAFHIEGAWWVSRVLRDIPVLACCVGAAWWWVGSQGLACRVGVAQWVGSGGNGLQRPHHAGLWAHQAKAELIVVSWGPVCRKSQWHVRGEKLSHAGWWWLKLAWGKRWRQGKAAATMTWLCDSEKRCKKREKHIWVH